MRPNEIRDLIAWIEKAIIPQLAGKNTDAIEAFRDSIKALRHLGTLVNHLRDMYSETSPDMFPDNLRIPDIAEEYMKPKDGPRTADHESKFDLKIDQWVPDDTPNINDYKGPNRAFDTLLTIKEPYNHNLAADAITGLFKAYQEGGEFQRLSTVFPDFNVPIHGQKFSKHIEDADHVIGYLQSFRHLAKSTLETRVLFILTVVFLREVSRRVVFKDIDQANEFATAMQLLVRVGHKLL